jgi:hypothetical protein
MHGVNQPKSSSFRPPQSASLQRIDGTIACLAAYVAHSVDDPTAEPHHFWAAPCIPRWRTPMEQEFEAFLHNNTWHLVPLVPCANIINSKWVFKFKCHSNGTIERYKTCMVAKGFRQSYGLDYEHTFSHLVKATTIRLLLTTDVTQGWSMRQLDVQNPFLMVFLRRRSLCANLQVLRTLGTLITSIALRSLFMV